MNAVGIIVALLILARLAAQLWLSRLNARHVRAHAASVPEALQGILDEQTYGRSVAYTLAKGRLGRVEDCFDATVLLAVLFSGLLPRVFDVFRDGPGESVWAMAAFLFAVGLALSLLGLPFRWYAQFHLEARFGFNTTTPGLWWTDRLKGLLLSVALGYPLLALVLKLAAWAGEAWWLWAWGSVLGVQLLMTLLAPVLIMPLFNKFTPLPNGPLRERLLGLARRTGFRAQSVQVMDGSKRSRHSNAFFTGLGRFRKIVLFDTLIQQLTEPQLEAVLAHEIGHYKLKHIPAMLGASALGLLAGFWALAWLARQAWLYRSFGFEPGSFAPALLLFGLLGGVVTFWLSPVLNAWLRRCEYQADAFAAAAMNEPDSLVGALRRLHEKNLSNLTPHPLYSGFHYSHPTLPERERALRPAGGRPAASR